MCSIKTISALPGHPDPVVLEPDFNRVHEIFEKLADRYGKLFTVQFANRPLVVVANANQINFILRKRPDLFGPYSRKNRVLETMKVDGIEAADDHGWKRQREVIAASMESRHMAQYFEYIKAATGDLKNHWITHGENLSKIDLEAEILGFSISVFTTMVFGDLTDMPVGEQEVTKNILHNLVPILGRRIDALLPQMHLESFSENKYFDEDIREIFRVVKNVIARKGSLLNDTNGAGNAVSMVRLLIEAMKEKCSDIRNIKLIENILLIVLASEPTTANTLLRVLFCIAKDPQVQRDIQDEVDAVLGNGGIIEDIEDIKKLKCIDAVILETMRTSSVSRLAIVEAKADLVMDDVEIPAGTPLVLLIARCALDDENFHQARVFDHRRWRSETKAESSKHNGKAFLGFGSGPRSCPGRGLAMLVIKSALAMICGNFQIRLSPEKQPGDKTGFNDKPLSFGLTIEIRDRRHDVAL